eukprot:5584570-Karenia_brevis.AAC.1
MIVEQVVSWQCGYCGIRIGEASHPGPENEPVDPGALAEAGYADLERSCFGDGVVAVADTYPPSGDSMLFARTQERDDGDMGDTVRDSWMEADQDFEFANDAELNHSPAGAADEPANEPANADSHNNTGADSIQEPDQSIQCPFCPHYRTRGSA